MADIKYLQMDITGWSKKAKDFLKKHLECASVYQMSFGPCMEEEIDHYIAIRGESGKLDRVMEIIRKRYKKYPGETSIHGKDELAFPHNEGSTTTYAELISRFIEDKTYRQLVQNLNEIAREETNV